MSSVTFTPEGHVPGLQDLLQRCRSMVRMHHGIGGLAVTACGVMVSVLAACLLDWLFVLPSVVRLGLLCGTGVLTAWLAWKFVLRPLLSGAPDVELAAAVDLQYPDLHEAVATVIALSQPATTLGEAGSALMRSRLDDSLKSRIDGLRPARIVPARRTVQRCGLASVTLIVMLVPLIVWPSGSMLLLKRLLSPFANHAAPTDLYFEIIGGDRAVAAGTNVDIVAIPRWRSGRTGTVPEGVTLQVAATSGDVESLPMEYLPSEGHFTGLLADVRDSFRFRVRSGTVVSEWIQLTVADPPRILSAVLVETPPAYTARPIETYDGVVGDIAVFERSTIDISLTFNKPVAGASLEWAGTRGAGSGSPDDSSAGPDSPSREVASIAADGLSANIRFMATTSGTFDFEIRDDLGLTNSRGTSRRLTVVTDMPPELQVSGIRDQLEVRPDDIVPIHCEVTDDIGVGELELHFQRNEEAVRIEPAVLTDRGAVSVSHDFLLDLKSLGSATGDTVTIRVKAADERPEPGPQVVWKGPWTLRIADSAEAIGRGALREEDQRLIDALRKLEEELRQDSAKAHELKDKLWQQWDDEQQQQVQTLNEKEQTQGRELQQLASEAAAHPLMQKPAAQLSKLSEQMRKDVPEKLAAAMTPEKNDAHRELNQAAQDLNRIQDELHRAADEIQRAAELEQELAELNRLAADAQQLAETATDLQQDRQQPEPDPGQTPEQRKEELAAREQKLQQDQRQLTEELGGLLQRRPELLQAAREAQLEEAAALAEQAQQLAQQEQFLAEGIQEESRDVARDAQPLADRLQRARNEADQIGHQIQQHAQDVPRPDVQPLDEAIRDLRQGNLTAPQQNIGRVQDQLEQAAAQLDVPREAPPVDPNAPPLDERAQDQADDRLREENKRRAELQRKAAEVASELEQIEAAIAEQAASLAAAPQSPDAGSESSESDPANPSADREAHRSALEQLARMTEAADQQADELRQTEGVHDSARNHARNAADRAAEALRHARAGQFSRAAERMRNTASDSSHAADNLNQPEQQDAREQLQTQRDDFNRMADSFQQMQQDNEAQVDTQQQAQQQVAEAAEQLPAPLEELAERLNIPQLGMQHLSRPAAEAAQAAREGAQTGDLAGEQLNEAQLQQAGQTAQEAAGQLNRAMQLAQQAAQGHRDPNAIIPGEVGDSVNDALHSLQQASQMMTDEAAARQAAEQAAQAAREAAAQSSPASPSGDSQPGEAGQPPGEQSESAANAPAGDAADASGQPAQSQEGQASSGSKGEQSPAEGDAGQQGQPGQNSASPGSSDRLAQAAQALRRAAQGALPGKFGPGQLSGDSSSSSSVATGDGSREAFNGRIPDGTRRTRNGRQWGALQDKLDDDIQDAGRESLDSEYAELIRRYRRDLAREQGK